MESSCPECRAIQQEFREAFAAARDRLSTQAATPSDLTSWIAQLDEDECARMREMSDLWKTWRRLQEHRIATGHLVTLAAGLN